MATALPCANDVRGNQLALETRFACFCQDAPNANHAPNDQV